MIKYPIKPHVNLAWKLLTFKWIPNFIIIKIVIFYAIKCFFTLIKD